MGDVGDFWRDVHAARKAAGLPARRRVRPRAEAPSRQQLRQFAQAGFEQKGEWHWQMRLAGDLLDYWPSRGKWQWRGKISTGPWSELVKLINGAHP
jgi:hypothetical protein